MEKTIAYIDKPASVTVTSFRVFERKVLGLGDDGKIYRWLEKNGQWVLHARPRPKEQQ